jgi:aspartate carbamoyltransferase catalytic subunit
VLCYSAIPGAHLRRLILTKGDQLNMYRADHSEFSLHRHLLDVESWSASDLTGLLALAAEIRSSLDQAGGKLDWLHGINLITLFYENSTRTRVSFELAGKLLGAEAITITASTSSVVKGESLQDTISTLNALGADIIVMRHPQSGAAETAATFSRAAIVNAGDGWHAHPTQALLDLYTLRERLGDLRHKRIVILGDVMHSRVGRSNCWSLTEMGAEVILCGSPTLVPATFAAAYPDRAVHVEYDVERALAQADAVMALRLQKERMTSGFLPSLREYRLRYGLTAQRLAPYPHLPILHPGPMNEGVEIDPEIAHGPNSLVERQVTNGPAIRMAVLLWAAGRRDLSAEPVPAEEVHHV